MDKTTRNELMRAAYNHYQSAMDIVAELSDDFECVDQYQCERFDFDDGSVVFVNDDGTFTEDSPDEDPDEEV